MPGSPLAPKNINANPNTRKSSIPPILLNIKNITAKIGLIENLELRNENFIHKRENLLCEVRIC
jgi:hypothetical protein